jgi:hypothetical protein
MNAALRARRLSQEEAGGFQIQVMDILRDLILRYTNGTSTSVKVDVAEDILNSLYYCIDAGLQSLNDNEAALELIRRGSAGKVYKEGLARVTACFQESRDIYLKLRKSKLNVGLEAYDLTIDEGLGIFFEKYGPVFHAHNAISSIDYPLLFDDMSIKGVFYMKAYMETLLMENSFCRLFPEQDIRSILASLGRIYRIDYTKTLTNIFEIVLNGALFSVLSGPGPITLKMTEIKYRMLESKLGAAGDHELGLMVDEGIRQVINDLKLKDESLIDYILKYRSMVKARLASALETDSLRKLVLLEEGLSLYKDEQIFIDGERMGNMSFRKLAERLSRELDPGVKVNMIRSEVHSLEDFIDILEGSCFFGDEYFCLFSRLSRQELALLAAVVFSDEMRDGPMDINMALDLETEMEVEWQNLFVEFLNTLKAQELESIQNCMNVMG